MATFAGISQARAGYMHLGAGTYFVLLMNIHHI